MVLQFISYIGCGISIACLLVAIVFFLFLGWAVPYYQWHLPTVVILFLRRELFAKVHYFIHLNLSITLCLAYITFVAGIEKGAAYQVGNIQHDTFKHEWGLIPIKWTFDIKFGTLSVHYSRLLSMHTLFNMQASCIVVAALLHYLFLSVFCWMLCEGIMLYLMLVLVFSKISRKWWIFLIIGYGGFLNYSGMSGCIMCLQVCHWFH